MSGSSKKHQLRQLMKATASSAPKAHGEADMPRVHSSLARHAADGSLTCILCNRLIRSTALWNAHCASDDHKQKLLELQKKKELEEQEKWRDGLEPAEKRRKSNEVTTEDLSEELRLAEKREQEAKRAQNLKEELSREWMQLDEVVRQEREIDEFMKRQVSADGSRKQEDGKESQNEDRNGFNEKYSQDNVDDYEEEGYQSGDEDIGGYSSDEGARALESLSSPYFTIYDRTCVKWLPE
ncbi:zinc finger protein 830-like isoform X2 [Schistocerca gregaria]|uniref:zinc finger protein 830-like isoform X2 n=1 Tax=Schistocerca gregaria TaxID=7010 RepID=UPI00211DD9DA|nr:zinc finger protein 830-like isoform X2 [Schistocerca gregaria]